MSRNWLEKETEKGGERRVFQAAGKAGPKPEIREVTAKSKDERHSFCLGHRVQGKRASTR